MKILPSQWWKLSFLWLFKGDSQKSKANPQLFQNSVIWAALGLALGVGALSVTLAITSGFENSLSRIVARAQGDVVHYTKWASVTELNDTAEISKELGIPNVGVEYFWKSHGLVVGKQGGRGVLIEGKFNPRERNAVTQDSPAIPEVSIGKPLAEYLGVVVGDQLKILLPGLIKGAIPVRVAELTSFGMYEIDSRYLSIDDRALKQWLEFNDPKSYAARPGDAFAIRYFLGEDYRSNDQRPAVEAWLNSYYAKFVASHPNDPDPELMPWWIQRKNLFGSIDLDKNLLTLVLSLLVLVSTLNVAATLVVLFLERERDIAIVRALGLTRGQLVQWTGLIGLLIGTVASSLGLIFGRLMGWILLKLPWAELPAQVYRISRLPLEFSFTEQSFVFLFGVAASTTLALALGFVLARKPFLEILGYRL